jgi:hypothetical protein
MGQTVSEDAKISMTAAWLALATAAATILLLASLHVLSPEFDPSWRMVSEYANGRYDWVLSLMFASWGVSSWALAFAIRSEVRPLAGKIGLVFLIAAGIGEAMASVFDINHEPLHDIAGFIGVLSLPVAAMLIGVCLGRMPSWSAAKKALLWTANLTWICVVLLVVSLVALGVTFTRAGGHVPADRKAPPPGARLPAGTVALAGYANRCWWSFTACG